MHRDCINRFEPLSEQADSSCRDEHLVEGYKWFGKPRNNQTSQRGEGGVGFLVYT